MTGHVESTYGAAHAQSQMPPPPPPSRLAQHAHHSHSHASTMGADDMPFLEQVVCDICLSPFYSSTEVQSVFWLTSCHHVLCGKKDGRHQHKQGICSCCGQQGISATPIDQNLRPDQRSWFTAPDITISQLFKAADRTEFHLRHLLNANKALTAELNRFKAAQQAVREVVDELRQLRQEHEKLQQQYHVMAEENTKLKSRLASIPPSRRTSQSFVNGAYMSPRTYETTYQGPPAGGHIFEAYADEQDPDVMDRRPSTLQSQMADPVMHAPPSGMPHDGPSSSSSRQPNHRLTLRPEERPGSAFMQRPDPMSVIDKYAYIPPRRMSSTPQPQMSRIMGTPRISRPGSAMHFGPRLTSMAQPAFEPLREEDEETVVYESEQPQRAGAGEFLDEARASNRPVISPGEHRPQPQLAGPSRSTGPAF